MFRLYKFIELFCNAIAKYYLEELFVKPFFDLYKIIYEWMKYINDHQYKNERHFLKN